MAKPVKSSICSDLVKPAKVRACCVDLKPDYDMTSAIARASALFFRLTGRQPKFAGSCTHVVYPCDPSRCRCNRSSCYCTFDSVLLPNVCEVERVTVDGFVVDPRTYALSGSKLVNLDGYGWPVRQDLTADAAPVASFTSVSGSGVTFNRVTIFKNSTGCFTVNWGVDFALSSLPAGHVVEVKGEDGWVWLFPKESLTQASSSTWTYCADVSHGTFTDVLNAADGYMVRSLQVGATQPSNIVFSVEHAKVYVRSYVLRERVVSGRTFEIVYRTGCDIPLEVETAVAKLACEFALDECGSEACRLPTSLRSFKLDGDVITRETHGLTGLPEVDDIILSINPRGLYRSARILGGVSGRRVLRRVSK